jgi:hypothetical protein
MTPFPKSIVAQLLRKASSHDVYLGLRAAIREGNTMGVGIFAENIDITDMPKILEYAVKSGNLPCLDSLLVSSKVNTNDLNPSGPELFHMACSDGNLAIVKRLSTLTTDINKADRQDANTPLHSASGGGHDAVVTFLLEEGAEINAENYDGKTPLQMALDNSHHGTQKLLVAKGGLLEED